MHDTCVRIHIYTHKAACTTPRSTQTVVHQTTTNQHQRQPTPTTTNDKPNNDKPTTTKHQTVGGTWGCIAPGTQHIYICTPVHTRLPVCTRLPVYTSIYSSTPSSGWHLGLHCAGQQTRRRSAQRRRMRPHLAASAGCLRARGKYRVFAIRIRSASCASA